MQAALFPHSRHLLRNAFGAQLLHLVYVKLSLLNKVICYLFGYVQ